MEVNLSVTPNEKGQVEIIHRTGEAAKPEVKSDVSLTGSIGSVIDFETKLRPLIVANHSHLIMDNEKREILFVVNEADRVRLTVSGTMQLHPYIKELGINSDERDYTVTELIKKLKLNRRFFATRTEHASIVSALQSFSARTETEFQDSDNRKGNKAFSIIQKVTHEMPLEFNMTIPIFVGEEPVTFKVDIEVTPENSSLVFNLVSVELMEGIESIQNEKWKKVQEHFKEYVIITR